MIKNKINDSVFLSQVIERLAFLMECEPVEKLVAKRLGLSPADFSNRKRRGTLLLLIIQWAIENKKSIDWLLTGKETSGAQAACPPPGHVLIPLPRGEPGPLSKRQSKLLEKALVVLMAGESATQFAESLENNINTFHKGVQLTNQVAGPAKGKAARKSS